MEDSILSKEQTIANWVKEYSDDLFSWALHKTSKREVAEDLVQETYLSAVKSFNSFKNNSSPKTWLLKILNNKIIDYYRKSSKHIFSNLETTESNKAIKGIDSFFDHHGNWTINGLESKWEDETHLLDNPEFNQIMGICMDDLPKNWKTAVQWKYQLDRNPKEICQELNITPSNYWQIVHRAKLMLKKCLEIKWFVS